MHPANLRIPNPSILQEPIADGNQVILWLPESVLGELGQWERIATLPRAQSREEAGICFLPATSIRARGQGLFAKIWQSIRPEPKGQIWTLPNGHRAEQIGSRRNDVMLAWAQDGTLPLDEARLKSHCPESETVEKIGDNLFLIRGVESP